MPWSLPESVPISRRRRAAHAGTHDAAVSAAMAGLDVVPAAETLALADGA